VSNVPVEVLLTVNALNDKSTALHAVVPVVFKLARLLEVDEPGVLTVQVGALAPLKVLVIEETLVGHAAGAAMAGTPIAKTQVQNFNLLIIFVHPQLTCRRLT
jgi:hypothetical protein